jgi:thiosulfate/3-mercaptopyruvate sulfurtransferase
VAGPKEGAEHVSLRQVDPDYIAAHLDDRSVRLVEVDVSPAQYQAGHIPGAVLWDAYADLRRADYTTIPDEQLRALVRHSGIGPDTTVVTYGYAAHLGYWLLRSYGHERVGLMDGSRDRWVEAGQVWSSDVPQPDATGYELPAQRHFVASSEEVVALMADSTGILLDVRSDAEYTGGRFWPSGTPEAKGRPGHIPGAVHLPIDSLRTSDGLFRSETEMRQVLAEGGLTPTSDVVVYCTIGNRAAQAWFALATLLGYEKVRVYYDSYVEWGMDPTSSIEV